MTKYALTIEYEVSDDDTAKMVASEAIRAVTTRGLRVDCVAELIAEAAPTWTRTKILWPRERIKA